MESSCLKALLLHYLQQQPALYVSGGRLSEVAGTSRTAVWKHIEELRQKGYQIEAIPKKGYILSSSPDALFPEEILANLFTRFCGKNIQYFNSVSSTNQAAYELGLQEAPEGTLVLAEEQTSGKGRRGRIWHSSSGKGIWMSLLFYPRHLLPNQIASITAAAGVMTAESLEESTGCKISLKWPNDLLVDGKKFGGILTEIKSNQEAIDFLVLGIGLNIHHQPSDFPEDLRSRATSLAETAEKKLNRAAICRNLLHKIEEGYSQFLTERFEGFRERWKDLSDTLGKRVTVDIGNQRMSGWAKDLDLEGSLVLEDEKGKITRLSYGEILEQ